MFWEAWDPLMVTCMVMIATLTIGFVWVVRQLFGAELDDASASPIKEDTEPTSRSRRNSSGQKKGGKPNGTTEKKGRNKPRSRTSSLTDYPSTPHHWQAAIFKGHKESITDIAWSSNGKFIATCARDRTILVWFAKDVLSKDRKSIRVNVPFDNARLIAWSPDSTAFIASLEEEKVLEVFKLGKKTEGAHVTINPLTKFKKVHEEEIIGIGISCTGLYIMSCSTDGNMVIWDLKGSVLERLSVPMANVTSAKVSPCGRYVAVCGNDCLMYAIDFNLLKEFLKVRTSGKLKGHESKVVHIDFNADSTKIVTVTENGVFRLFDTTGGRINVACMGRAKDVPSSGSDFAPTISMSPDGRLVGVAYNAQIDIFEMKLSGPYTQLDPIWTIEYPENLSSVLFSSDGKFLLAACDKSIRVLYNVYGHRVTLKSIVEQIQNKSTGASFKDRLCFDGKKIIAELNSINCSAEAEAEISAFNNAVATLSGSQ